MRGGCRVRLCWWRKKSVGDVFNLHELESVHEKTMPDESCRILEKMRKSVQAGFPETAEFADDIPYVWKIDGRILIHERTESGTVWNGGNDLYLVRQGDLGVRDDKSRQKGMGGAAEAAEQTLDTKRDISDTALDLPDITAVSDQTSLMRTARAFKLAEIQGKNDGIVKILWNKVEIFNLNRYHNRCFFGAAFCNTSETWDRRNFGRWLLSFFAFRNEQRIT